MNTPSLDAIRALDGRIFAMLSTEEQLVLDFYRDRGRKFDVSVSILNKADPAELARTCSREQADQVMKSANSRVLVHIGPNAESAWATSASNE